MILATDDASHRIDGREDGRGPGRLDDAHDRRRVRQLRPHDGQDRLDGGLCGQLGECLGVGGKVVAPAALADADALSRSRHLATCE